MNGTTSVWDWENVRAGDRLYDVHHWRFQRCTLLQKMPIRTLVERTVFPDREMRTACEILGVSPDEVTRSFQSYLDARARLSPSRTATRWALARAAAVMKSYVR